MRSVRMRILAALLIVSAAGAVGWQLMPTGADHGKTITVGTTDSVTALDPAGAYDAGSWAMFSNVFQSLLTYRPDGTAPVPDAAKSCGFKGSGLRTYVCVLRDDLDFPSGRRMTAEDVKFSFERVKHINSDVGPASLLGTLASVDAKGLTVTFHLNSPDATFPFKVATGAGAIVDRERYSKDGLRTDTGADGTGPYVLKTYTKEKQALLEPNEHYKGAVKSTGRPIRLRYYADPAALDKAWKAKQIDVATRQLPPAVLAGLSPSDPGQQVIEAASAETRNLVVNVRASSPLHDPLVRRALAWLVNREELAGTVYQGTAEPLYSLIPAGLTGHTTSFFDEYPKPNVKRARALLTEAGVELPVSFTYGYAKGRGVAAEEAALLKRQLEKGGLFKVTVKGYEWTDYQKRYAAGKLDAYAVGWVADFPDPDTFTGPLVGTGNSMKNEYSSKKVDRLILDSRQYADRARAAQDFRALQQLIAQDVPVIPLWQRKEYVVSSVDVSGGQYLSDGTGVFRLWTLDWI
ncbi:ABC transporter substrate-binding protein [Streptomyces sp. SID12488]|uniref:ABC transporter substrate-binding protein n=1 Tax=Streptomyces sp. SID12488 TaxID=2706040 RepID=UPI0013DCEEAD|nr:ABC transporter substrate-binding protein [Streptomyces sp. SID12488]NEA62358.1 peptide-binding protein [Streptomyces sp. SID12488]